MILEKAIVPDIKDGCPTKRRWKPDGKLILNTLSEIEYGNALQLTMRSPERTLEGTCGVLCTQYICGQK